MKKKDLAKKQEAAAQANDEAVRSTMLASLTVPFNVDKAKMKALKKFEEIENSESCVSEPFLLQMDLPASWKDTELVKTLQLWSGSFQKQDLARKNRCVAAPLRPNMGADAVIKAFNSVAAKVFAKTKVLDAPPASIAAVVDVPNLLGFMQDCVFFFLEPELGATFRFQVEGSLDVMIARVSCFSLAPCFPLYIIVCSCVLLLLQRKPQTIQVPSSRMHFPERSVSSKFRSSPWCGSWSSPQPDMNLKANSV